MADSEYTNQQQGDGLRRRGKNNNSNKRGSKVGDSHAGGGSNTDGSVFAKGQRQSMIVEWKDENSDSELDRPLIANEAQQSHRTSYATGVSSGANTTTTDEHQHGSSIGAADHSPYGRRDSDERGASLTTSNNGAWNRLSCVSHMLHTVSAGCTSATNGASTAPRHGPVFHKAVDVACAVIDKLPDFVGSKFGPNPTNMEGNKKVFLERFRNAFVATYNKHDAAHVSMAQELYRNFYAICCQDADPLVNVKGYVKHFAGKGLEAGVVEEEFGKDMISSEYWKMIGFQGTNPATDFRGGGCLSLLLLLHLFKNRSDLIRSIFTVRERAPSNEDASTNTVPSSSATTTTYAASDSTSSATGAPKSSPMGTPPDYHHVPPFFAEEMKAYLADTSTESDQPTGGALFMTCEYPFAIAAINVAMHLMLLLGVERNTTCLATTSNIFSFSARLAKAAVVDITYNDNGNCSEHDVPPRSCRVFLDKMIKEAASHTSYAAQLDGDKATQLMEGFEHLCAIYEVAIAVMHNEWDTLPAKEKNILYFNQVLARARSKLELMLRHSNTILELNKAVMEFGWITH